jgi:hypothetical protein
MSATDDTPPDRIPLTDEEIVWLLREPRNFAVQWAGRAVATIRAAQAARDEARRIGREVQSEAAAQVNRQGAKLDTALMQRDEAVALLREHASWDGDEDRPDEAEWFAWIARRNTFLAALPGREL